MKKWQDLLADYRRHWKNMMDEHHPKNLEEEWTQQFADALEHVCWADEILDICNYGIREQKLESILNLDKKIQLQEKRREKKANELVGR